MAERACVRRPLVEERRSAKALQGRGGKREWCPKSRTGLRFGLKGEGEEEEALDVDYTSNITLAWPGLKRTRIILCDRRDGGLRFRPPPMRAERRK